MGASDRQLETTLALDKDGGIVEGLSGAASKFSNENYGKVVKWLLKFVLKICILFKT